MRQAPGSLLEQCRRSGLLLVWLVAMGVASAEDRPMVQGSRAQSPSVVSDEASAEMNLPIPTRYAVVLHEPGKIRTLHTRTDILFDPRNPLRSFTIVQVEANGMTLRENRTGRVHIWRPGGSVEGLEGLVLAGTVMLKQLRYRYRAVERVTQLEPVLVALEGPMAVLEKEMLRQTGGPSQGAPSPVGSRALPQTSSTRSPTLSTLLRAKEIDADTYEMDGPSLRPALENVGQFISDLKLMVSPTLSVQTGVGYNVSSAFADGFLSQSGFTVTNSKAAQVFGIDVGDTILQINNTPVTSPLSAWWAYQEAVIKNPTQSEVRVNIRREGSLVTKTFRIK